MDTEEAEDWSAHVGQELRKTYRRYEQDGFFAKYFAGPNILDIGYKGYVADAQPIFPHATGIDLDYPGYDGRTLPFADESQDTVFASHALEHIPDYRQALREWFRVLKIGGHMVVAVPHQYLYERKLTLPSRFNGDHQRLYTAAALMAEIEDALDPMSFRLRHLEDNDEHFDYKIPPERHAGGCYELVMVLQRIRRPDYAEAMLSPPPPPPVSNQGRFLRVANLETEEPLLTIDSDTPARRLLVMKLDHRGDFIMAYPAFKALRERFVDAHITLACGPWTEADAKQTGWFDEVITARYFPEIASEAYHDFHFSYDTAAFSKAVAGRSWDLAIDLRLDQDTRKLLADVNAKHRAGFGTAQDFGFLDIFLPYINPTVANRTYRRVMSPANFNSRVGRHAGVEIVQDNRRDVRNEDDILLFGPWERFEAGLWRMEVALEPLRGGFDIAYDVCSDSGHVIHQVGRLKIRPGIPTGFNLQLDEDTDRLEVRLRAAATGRLPTFRFHGIKASKKGTLPALHQQEMQALLVTLVGLRMQNPFLQHELKA